MLFRGRPVNPYPLGYVIVVLVIILFAVAMQGCAHESRLKIDEKPTFKDICISICHA